MFCNDNNLINFSLRLCSLWTQHGFIKVTAGYCTPTIENILLSIGAGSERYFTPVAITVLQMIGLDDDGWMYSSFYVKLSLIIWCHIAGGGLSSYFAYLHELFCVFLLLFYVLSLSIINLTPPFFYLIDLLLVTLYVCMWVLHLEVSPIYKNTIPTLMTWSWLSLNWKKYIYFLISWKVTLQLK